MAILNGDAYPHLKGPGRAGAGGGPALGARLAVLVSTGHFQQGQPEEVAQACNAMLRGAWLDLFSQAQDQLRLALESALPEQRRWALASILALLTLDDLQPLPEDTLPLLRGWVGRALLKEHLHDLADAALEVTARILGIEAMAGDLRGVEVYLVWLAQASRQQSIGYAERIRASAHMVGPALACYRHQGQASLVSRVLPFLHFLGEPGADSLVRLLEAEPDQARRKSIVDLLRQLGHLGLPALEKSLVTGSWHLVRNALNLVEALGAPEAFEYVVPCLEHRDPRVLRAAVRALIRTGGPRAERYLLELLPASAPERQIELLEGLAAIRASAAIPMIGGLAGSAPEAVRVAALTALGHLGDPHALPILEKALLGRHGLFRTAEPLPIRLASARALVALGSAAARHLLDQAIAAEPKGAGRDALREASRPDPG